MSLSFDLNDLILDLLVFGPYKLSIRRTKYSQKLYELNDCDVRSMLWYKLVDLVYQPTYLSSCKLLLPVFKQMYTV
jgi:hypothetical protein